MEGSPSRLGGRLHPRGVWSTVTWTWTVPTGSVGIQISRQRRDRQRNPQGSSQDGAKSSYSLTGARGCPCNGWKCARRTLAPDGQVVALMPSSREASGVLPLMAMGPICRPNRSVLALEPVIHNNHSRLVSCGLPVDNRPAGCQGPDGGEAVQGLLRHQVRSLTEPGWDRLAN